MTLPTSLSAPPTGKGESRASGGDAKLLAGPLDERSSRTAGSRRHGASAALNSRT